MISKGQSIILGTLLGVILFILYVRLIPQSHVEVEVPSLKTLQLRVEPSVGASTGRPVPRPLDSASVESKVEKSPHRQPSLSDRTPTLVASKSVRDDLPSLPARTPSPLKEENRVGNRVRDPAVFCPKLMRKHHIVPGSSWGTTTLEQQRLWSNLNCDQFISSAKDGNTGSEPPLTEKADPPSSNTGVSDQSSNGAEEEEEVQVGMPVIPKDHRKWCQNAREKYKVKPMKSWGSLPPTMIDDWKNKHCDLVFTANRMGKRPLSQCPNQNVSSTSPDDHSNLSPSLPLIAIMAATTTRRIPHPSTSNLALFTLLLPSLMRSLDCGYRYEYVLGYDQGDPFYDSEEGLKEVKKWFYKNVRQPMKKNGISLKLRVVKVNNTLKKPGPVFLEMARAAYAAGAQYFYRINDDTELTTVWPKVFVATLQSMGTPYGVVGPYCDQGNQKILTHDFVHRTHMEIFEMNYYPPQLSDWWMDDWISWVYGQTRTFKARSTSVIHHTGAHGQRYQVDQSHELLLGDLVKQGRQKIRQYMLKQQVDGAVLKRFDQDTAAPGFVHRDIPVSVKDQLLTGGTP